MCIKLSFICLASVFGNIAANPSSVGRSACSISRPPVSATSVNSICVEFKPPGVQCIATASISTETRSSSGQSRNAVVDFDALRDFGDHALDGGLIQHLFQQDDVGATSSSTFHVPTHPTSLETSATNTGVVTSEGG